MRRITALALMAMTCVALMATPALAQRDPFDPLIDPNAPTTTTTTTTGGTTTTTGTTGGSQVFQPTDGSDALANTGADVAPWMAIAYSLIVVGAGALALARMYQPHPVRRS